MRLFPIFLLCSCTISDRYLISAQSANALSQLTDAQRATAAVPATRKGKSTFVRGSTIHLSAFNGATASGESVEVTARAPSPMMTAGSLLTWIGTAISVAGTVLFFTFPDGDKHWAGVGLALSAEAVMWPGAGLWIVAAGKHPQEVGAGHSDLHYLPEASRN